MKSICLIIPYFGKWPRWFNFFLETCRYNETIDWIFFTDCSEPENKCPNVQFIPFTLKDFNSLATQKLGFEINIKHPYKLCDFKPAYGVIFNDYLKKYDFWGYCDVDLVFGNIRKFFNIYLLEKNDIITIREGILAGYLTLYRNISTINTLFQINPDYKKLFQNQKLYQFDEKFVKYGYILSSNKFNKYYYKSIQYVMHYLKQIIIYPSGLSVLRNIRKKWLYFINKNELLYDKNDNNDMTRIVINLSKKEKITSYFKNISLTDNSALLKKTDWKIIWKKGKLIEYSTKEEFILFHFNMLKYKKDYITPKYFFISDKFEITKKGFNIA